MNTERKQHTYEVGIIGRELPQEFVACSIAVDGDGALFADADNRLVFFAPGATISYIRRLDKAAAAEPDHVPLLSAVQLRDVVLAVHP